MLSSPGDGYIYHSVLERGGVTLVNVTIDPYATTLNHLAPKPSQANKRFFFRQGTTQNRLACD